MAEIKCDKAGEFTPLRMGRFKEMSFELTLSGVLIGRDGKGSSGRSKQVRKSPGRAISRLIVPGLEQRKMKLVIGCWIDWLIGFFFFIHLFFHSFNHAYMNALVNSTNIYPGP